MHIALRVDASAQIGTGHVMRCLTLADALKAQGAHTLFVCRHLTPFLAQKITEGRHKLIILPSVADSTAQNGYAAWLGTSQEQDAQDTRMALEGRYWDWLVVDHYALDVQWETA